MTVWLEIGGRERRVELPADALGSSSSASGAVECVVDGRPLAVDFCVLQPGVMSLVVAGRQFRCVLDGDAVVGFALLIAGVRYEFEVADPRSLKGRKAAGAGADGPRSVKAPMPGRVVRVLVGVGDEVGAQQGVVVIEAMKMQNELKSPKAGRVVRVAAVVGETVQQGDVLVVVE
jgi:acetyl/propionyl-CoA carboxylase alpha subunit